jgi:hypothetical protein
VMDLSTLTVERCVVRALAGGSVPLCHEGVPEALVGSDASSFGIAALIEEAGRTQGQDQMPLVVAPARPAVVEEILDAEAIARVCLLLVNTDEIEDRRGLEALPWRQWPRITTVDLGFCQPRVVEDGPGSALRLVGGLGLVTVGVAGPAAATTVALAELLPGLRSTGLAPRIAATELEAARSSLQRCEFELEHARQVIAELQRSTSWRLTAPLRRAKAAARSRGA